MSKPNGILAMNPDKYREIDGVVFDLDSYARHCEAPQPEAAGAADAPPAAPAPVFAVDPYQDGWYPAADGGAPVPVMGGALPPCEVRAGEDGGAVLHTVFVAASSGSGSYLTSYTTSYRTSYRSSGSGSYRFGSCACWVGGYGLELI